MKITPCKACKELQKEEGIAKCTDCYTRGYPITHVNIVDIESLGFTIKDITPEQMIGLANALESSYLNGSGDYWEDVESYCIEILKLKQN